MTGEKGAKPNELDVLEAQEKLTAESNAAEMARETRTRNPSDFATRRLFVTSDSAPLLWNRKKGTGGEKLRARCSFNRSHEEEERQDHRWNGEVNSREGLRLKRRGKREVKIHERERQSVEEESP